MCASQLGSGLHPLMKKNLVLSTRENLQWRNYLVVLLLSVEEINQLFGDLSGLGYGDE